ncbi:hypothetical protein ACJIZ3_024291 [Penstemon smallii]|uniref:Gag1-like clamp domain-containing protein n=1 Tax=Penstemon smallii TaxID=265156 RepID=A0ABD3TSF9_9LAMI
MDINGSNSHFSVNHSSSGLETTQQEYEPSIQDDCMTLFINYAAIAWHEMRRAWRGDGTHASQKMLKEPILSWSTTYEELLLSKEPFEKPVPLSEMVRFLAETWEEDGSYD